MKSSIKNLITVLCLVGGVIGITFAQEAVAEESAENTFNVNGEFALCVISKLISVVINSTGTIGAALVSPSSDIA